MTETTARAGAMPRTSAGSDDVAAGAAEERTVTSGGVVRVGSASWVEAGVGVGTLIITRAANGSGTTAAGNSGAESRVVTYQMGMPEEDIPQTTCTVFPLEIAI